MAVQTARRGAIAANRRKTGGGGGGGAASREFFETSETQGFTHVASGFQTAQAHQHAWLTSPTRLGSGHSERFEVHNSAGDIVNGQAIRAMADFVDTNEGGDAGGSTPAGPSQVAYAFSIFLPTVAGSGALGTVTSGFSQTAVPDYEHFVEIHERGNVNGGTNGINNIGEVTNHSVMCRSGQLQLRSRCGTWTWNGSGWNAPSWNTGTPGTTGSNDQIPIPIVKSGSTNATMVMDTWLDVILFVKFAKDSTGQVKIWARQSGQAFTADASPNVSITGPTHKVVVGSDSVTRSSADYEAANEVTGSYLHCGLYIGDTTWDDSQGAHIIHIDQLRRYDGATAVADAKLNWG